VLAAHLRSGHVVSFPLRSAAQRRTTFVSRDGCEKWNAQYPAKACQVGRVSEASDPWQPLVMSGWVFELRREGWGRRSRLVVMK